MACSVCLAELGTTQTTRLTPCTHVYHTACITEWIASGNLSCPLCRAAPDTFCVAYVTSEAALAALPMHMSETGVRLPHGGGLAWLLPDDARVLMWDAQMRNMGLQLHERAPTTLLELKLRGRAYTAEVPLLGGDDDDDEDQWREEQIEYQYELERRAEEHEEEYNQDYELGLLAQTHHAINYGSIDDYE